MPNLNDLAQEITEAEGLKKSLSIGQVKEVLKLTFTRMAKMTVVEVGEVLRKYKN